MGWRLHVLAKDDRAAAKVAARVGDLLDGRLVVEQIEPYWKIQEQRIVTAALALHAATLPEAVVEALRLRSRQWISRSCHAVGREALPPGAQQPAYH